MNVLQGRGFLSCAYLPSRYMIWVRVLSIVMQPDSCPLHCLQASNMMRVVGLVSLLVLQCAFCTVSAVSSMHLMPDVQPSHKLTPLICMHS